MLKLNVSFHHQIQENSFFPQSDEHFIRHTHLHDCNIPNSLSLVVVVFILYIHLATPLPSTFFKNIPCMYDESVHVSQIPCMYAQTWPIKVILTLFYFILPQNNSSRVHDHVACGYATLDSLMIQALLHSPSVRHAKSQLRGRLPFCLVTFTETPAAE